MMMMVAAVMTTAMIIVATKNDTDHTINVSYMAHQHLVMNSEFTQSPRHAIDAFVHD